MKKPDSAIKVKKHGNTAKPVNASIHRAVVSATGDFLSALIIEYIHYRVTNNDNKPVWLKIDWLLDELPYISRAGMAKKVNNLVKGGYLIKKNGEGRHYHKCWYSPSPKMAALCSAKTDSLELVSGKVYYNLEMAEENVEASVIYATILNLLRVEGHYENLKQDKSFDAKEIGRVDDKLVIDTKKLSEGSKLSLEKVRRAVKWLIDNKKIEARKGFGNKTTVWLPERASQENASVKRYWEPPTESFPQSDPSEDDPTEKYRHED